MQAAIRQQNVYCRTEPKTTAGCNYRRTCFIMRTKRKPSNGFWFIARVTQTIRMFICLMQISILSIICSIFPAAACMVKIKSEPG